MLAGALAEELRLGSSENAESLVTTEEASAAPQSQLIIENCHVPLGRGDIPNISHLEDKIKNEIEQKDLT